MLALSKFFACSTNDKSSACCDFAMQKVRGKSEVISGLEWGTFGEDGVERIKKAVYYICDEGHHQWTDLIAPCEMQIVFSKIE